MICSTKWGQTDSNLDRLFTARSCWPVHQLTAKLGFDEKNLVGDQGVLVQACWSFSKTPRPSTTLARLVLMEETVQMWNYCTWRHLHIANGCQYYFKSVYFCFISHTLEQAIQKMKKYSLARSCAPSKVSRHYFFCEATLDNGENYDRWRLWQQC